MITLTVTARCHLCGLLPADTPEAADKASEKHTRATGHPTAVVAVPGETAASRG